MKDLNLKIDKVEGSELIIRTGDAIEHKFPTPVKFSGTFQAVINYWLKRKVDVIKDLITRTRLEYSKTALTIALIIDEHKDYQDVISGAITVNPDLSSFGINNETTWTLEAFHKQIKLKRHLFHSPTEHADLLRQLITQKAKISTDLNKDSDNRGNKSTSFERKVDSNLPTTFSLILAPYKGYPTIQFPVEIYVDSDGNGIKLQLFSPELVAEQLKLQDQIFADTLKHFDEIPQMEK